MLLYPEAKRKYNPVKILTAEYHSIPNMVLDKRTVEKNKRDNAIA